MTTLEFVRRLERAEAEVSLRCAKACLAAGADVRVDRALGGWAIDFGPGSPLSQILHAGMQGAVDEAEFAEVEGRFFSRGIASTVSLCPFADPTLIEIIGRRGYRVSHFEHTLSRPLESLSAPPPHIRLAAHDDWPACGEVLTQAFFPNGGEPPGLRGLFETMFHIEGACAWLAEDAGSIASCGGLTLAGETAVLAGDGTRPAFRGRGFQNQLIVGRCAYALAGGATLAMACTVPGSSSQRNYERQGFRIAYTKALLVKEPPASA